MKSNLLESSGRNEGVILSRIERERGCIILPHYHVIGTPYVVDGYCPRCNTVYEVYEEAHLAQLISDVYRENKIRSILDCEFEIIWDISPRARADWPTLSIIDNLLVAIKPYTHPFRHWGFNV